ncbi:MAG: hypothetical protein K9I68_07000 [Bacteroidales bacterium]|nr:hypothetical protein [Bacteroidales bacterium]MCF8339134.1 hypothetical protein [Bacteroidales bacterium]
MKTVSVEIKNEKALALLRNLESLNLLRVLEKESNFTSKQNTSIKKEDTESKRSSFTVLETNTRDYKFNREEANER